MSKKRTVWRWLAELIAVIAIAGAGYYVVVNRGLPGQTTATVTDSSTTQTAASASADATTTETVAIQTADVAESQVSASGSLALVDERNVALDVSGAVNEIHVAVGDRVKAGDLLLQLDTTDLERTLALAQLSVESAKLALADLQTPATDAEIVNAQAALAEAQQNLADVKAGPNAEEIAAARSSLAAAQSTYAELQAGASQAELTQLSASLKKAEISLQEAQGAYDKVAWRGNATAESAALQSATIDYEAAKAAYEQSTAPATASNLQTTLSTIQSAQVKLNDLLNSPTPAEIASADAQVASAEAALADLQSGPTDNALRSAQITLQKALIELESANRELTAASVLAPIDGVVTELNVQIGVRSGADSIVAVVADPAQLELKINVAEADIPNVVIGQGAVVEIDALPGKTFSGVVQSISPINGSGSGAVSYPVTIRLSGDDLTGVLPGMNGVATLLNQAQSAENSWLVPTNALLEQNGASAVLVVRGETRIPVSVVRGAVKGEWTVVQSPELREGDEVVGSLTSQLSEQRSGFGGPPPDGGMPVGVGQP